MGPAELVENALEIGNRVDVQWGLFITVHLALLGALAYIDEPLHRIEKILGILVYVGFAAINFGQMRAQLELVNAAYMDIHQLVIDGNSLELLKRMSEEHAAGRHRVAKIVVNVSHGVMAILVGLSIIYHPLMTRKSSDSS